MSDFIEMLKAKLSELKDERDEHWDAIVRIDVQAKLINDLLTEANEENVNLSILPSPPSPAPPSETEPPVIPQTSSKPMSKKTKKRGRPKGSKNKPKGEEKKQKGRVSVEDFEAISKNLPGGMSRTTLEEQTQAIKRFNPAPRVSENYGGVRRGGKVEEVLPGNVRPKTDVSINVEED